MNPDLPGRFFSVRTTVKLRYNGSVLWIENEYIRDNDFVSSMEFRHEERQDKQIVINGKWLLNSGTDNEGPFPNSASFFMHSKKVVTALRM